MSHEWLLSFIFGLINLVTLIAAPSQSKCELEG